jgi:hypothetical protein
MGPWLALGRSNHRMPSLSRLISDFMFLLAPSDFNVYPVSTTNPEQRGDMMSEKTMKDKNGKDGPASKPAKAKTVKNRKGKTSEPELQGQRADGKAEETVHHSKLVAFSLKAPQTSLVFLAGCFNGWDPHATPLHWHEDGVWICSVSLEPGEHQYRFIVDGEWQNDPLNTRRLSNAFGTENCVLVVDR